MKSLRLLLVLHWTLAQSLLPTLGHAHAAEAGHDDVGFHVHLDGHSHDHDPCGEGFSPIERVDSPAVSAGMAAWEAVGPDAVNAACWMAVEFAATVNSWESWLGLPPDPLATPPTLAVEGDDIPLFLSFCSLRC